MTQQVAVIQRKPVMDRRGGPRLVRDQVDYLRLWLDDYCERNGLSLADLADQCGMPYSTILNLARRSEGSAGLDLILELSNRIAVPLEEMLGSEIVRFVSKKLMPIPAGRLQAVATQESDQEVVEEAPACDVEPVAEPPVDIARARELYNRVLANMVDQAQLMKELKEALG